MNEARNKITAELRTLLQLTQAEAQIAQVRRAQARTDAVERELAQNAANAEERTRLIADALRDLGGVPDVVSAALGRAAALVKGVLEQAQPLSEALLGDLALEHQLLDRARYVKVLAGTADQPRIRRLAERLEGAHQATVDWLTTVLAEEALGGPAALRPTPTQWVAGVTVRLAEVPARVLADRVNRTVDAANRLRAQTNETLTETVATAVRLREAVGEVVGAGLAASLAKAERVARREGATEAAEAVHQTRRDLGALSASELPIKDYDSLSNTEAIAAVKKLGEPADIRAVVSYEEAHKNRSSVVSAAQTQLAAVAKQVVGVA